MKFRQWLETFRNILPPTPENINAAIQFLREKWLERAKEHNRPNPESLEGACKFASMFAQRLFGGQLRGNEQHQFLVLPSGQIIDLTNAVGVEEENRTRHDRSFWGNPEHRKSLQSCEPRIERWVQEFLARKL
jgi:hypothetical protein